MGELLSPERVALELGVSAETIRRWCREGKIEGARRVGRQWRFTRAALEAALAVLGSPQPNKKPRPGELLLASAMGG